MKHKPLSLEMDIQMMDTEHFTPLLGAEQVANLRKLAEYLLSDKVGNFDMSWYRLSGDVQLEFHRWIEIKDSPHSCGTAGCAIGYGIEAGIHPSPLQKTWRSYTENFICDAISINNIHMSWCFSGAWEAIDNTPQGAANRILYMLEHGTPSNYSEQSFGVDPYIFAEGNTNDSIGK